MVSMVSKNRSIAPYCVNSINGINSIRMLVSRIKSAYYPYLADAADVSAKGRKRIPLSPP